jgi:hypothetical protein
MRNCASCFQFLDIIGFAEAQNARTINQSAARIIADVRYSFSFDSMRSGLQVYRQQRFGRR